LEERTREPKGLELRGIWKDPEWKLNFTGTGQVMKPGDKSTCEMKSESVESL
jgi:hypothetical protein